MSGFSMSDVKFRRCGEDECDIVVYGQLVGTLMRCPDYSLSGRKHVYWVHLYDDFRGPRRVRDRNDIQRTAAQMIADRDLVPSMPPPVHPDYAACRQHRSG